MATALGKLGIQGILDVWGSGSRSLLDKTALAHSLARDDDVDEECSETATESSLEDDAAFVLARLGLDDLLEDEERFDANLLGFQWVMWLLASTSRYKDPLAANPSLKRPSDQQVLMWRRLVLEANVLTSEFPFWHSSVPCLAAFLGVQLFRHNPRFFGYTHKHVLSVALLDVAAKLLEDDVCKLSYVCRIFHADLTCVQATECGLCRAMEYEIWIDPKSLAEFVEWTRKGPFPLELVQ